MTASLSGLSGYANVEIIQDFNHNGLIDNGDVLLQSYNTNNSTSIHQRLPAGTYFARVQQDGPDVFYTMSVTAPSAPVDPGNTLGSATNLGELSTSATVNASDWVGVADNEDDYSFTIDSSRDVTASLSGLSGYANVEIIQDYNHNGLIDNGDVLLQSYNTNSSVSIHQRLPAGTYFARVQQDGPDVFYTMSLTAPAAPVDPGNTPGAAKNLGALGTSGTVNVSDWVGVADNEDDYSFTINSSRDVTASLSGLSGYANVEIVQDVNGNGLIDNGDVLIQSYNTNSSVSVHQRLPAGAYIARVQQDGPDVFYTMSLTTPAAPVDPGNTPGTAQDLGALNGIINNSDWVGNADAEDNYRFTIASNRLVTASIAGLSGYASVQIIQDFNHNGLIDNGDILVASYNTNSSVSIQQQLGAGTYYARVIQDGPDVFYTLTLSSPVVQATSVGVVASDASASFGTGDPGTFTLTRGKPDLRLDGFL